MTNLIKGTRDGLPYRIEVKYAASPVEELNNKYISHVTCWINNQIIANRDVLGDNSIRPKPMNEAYIVSCVEKYIDNMQSK